MPHADRPADSPRDDTDVHVTSVEPSERPSEVVIDAVAAITGRLPETLPPLYDAVEPDALDSLFEHANASDLDSSVSHRVHFSYAGYDVEVRGDGVVRIRGAPASVAPE